MTAIPSHSLLPARLEEHWAAKPWGLTLATLAALAVVAVGNGFWATHGEWRTLRSIILWSVCVLILLARARLGTELAILSSATQMPGEQSRLWPFSGRMPVGTTGTALLLVVVAGELLPAGMGFLDHIRLIVFVPACLLLLYDWHRIRQRLASEIASRSAEVISAKAALALESLRFQGTTIAACGLAVVALGNALWAGNDLWLGVRPVAQIGLVFAVLCWLYFGGVAFVSELTCIVQDERRRVHNLSREWFVEDDPERDQLPSTKAILDALDLRPGMHVADFGTGGGYFAMKMAERVGPTGSVVATDVSAHSVAQLRQQAQRRELSHLQVRLVDAERPLPVSRQLDRILVVNVYLFSLANEAQGRAWLEQFASTLGPGGKLVLCNEFVHEAGWLESSEWQPLTEAQPDAPTVIQWAAPFCEPVAELPFPPSHPERPPVPHERPGYLIVLQRPA